MSSSQTDQWEEDRLYHESLFVRGSGGASSSTGHFSALEEVKTAPVFTAKVLEQAKDALPQYALLAKVLETYPEEKETETSGELSEGVPPSEGNPIESERKTHLDDNRLFINTNAPWSAFICGSQGSGKSHTLSCILEASLKESRLGPLPNPLAGMVFHFDKFSGFANTQVCEAAYLASYGIPVKVLVSPTSFHRMKKVYEDLPGFPAGAQKPTVQPLFFKQEHLSMERMMKLMAVDDAGKSALYMEIVNRILRSMALERPGTPGLNYDDFKTRLSYENFVANQSSGISMRLGLLESFMHASNASSTPSSERPDFPDTDKGRMKAREWQADQDSIRRALLGKHTDWSFEPGSLTIVDLSCPFVDERAACAMFNICLGLFLENRGNCGRIIALDEAHKFMTGKSEGNALTESLLSVVRQQRHLATRVIIATQEPTISPALLDLCSMTVVHRFTSPTWLKALESHLAGFSLDDEADKGLLQRLFNQIVRLNTGQALVFSPSAMLDLHSNGDAGMLETEKAGTRHLKIRIRNRLTADGGKSLMAAGK